MKLFIATLGTETNSFAPIPTGMANFAENTLFHGDATKHEPHLFTMPLHVWRRQAERDGHDVVESVAAFAQPAGPTVRRVYEELRDELLDDLKRALPVDVVLLSMHGAMIADGYDDCEGDTIERVRQLVGPETTIGVELDLHCHITRTMVDNATALVLFKEYPHIDVAERAAELYAICSDAASGKTKPHTAVHDCRMISMWRTPVEPIKGFVQRMQDLESEDGVLSVSFAHGFPWGDVADVGAKMLVVTDDNPNLGGTIAERLGRELWEMRHAAEAKHYTIDGALDYALAATGGPIVLADVADNAGGGASSDSTFVLQRLLERGVTNVASGCYWDPGAVGLCLEAGEGATLPLRIGGKVGPMSGTPVDLRVTVRKILLAATMPFGDATARLGDTVWVSADGIDLVLNTTRTQTFHPQAFTQLGIDLSAKKIVVVKSTQHFYAGFAPIAREILYMATPGAVGPDFAAIPFTKLNKPFWPRVEDPFA